MKNNGRRVPPALGRVQRAESRALAVADRDDPKRAAAFAASAALGRNPAGATLCGNPATKESFVENPARASCRGAGEACGALGTEKTGGAQKAEESHPAQTGENCAMRAGEIRAVGAGAGNVRAARDGEHPTVVALGGQKEACGAQLTRGGRKVPAAASPDAAAGAEASVQKEACAAGECENVGEAAGAWNRAAATAAPADASGGSDDSNVVLAQLLADDPSLKPLSREERARRFLSDYEFCGSLLDLSDRFDRIDAFYGREPSEWARSNAAYWRARRSSIVSLISGLCPSREKALLTLRYLDGLPIERVAERMSVSRRTAYRIHARALSLVAAVLEKKKKARP